MSATSATNRVEGGGAQQSPEQRSLSFRQGQERNRTSTTLSVIVPAYNEQYLVEASLKGLAVLDESPRLREIKVIVVNDCSTDRTAEAIQRFQSHLKSSQDFK